MKAGYKRMRNKKDVVKTKGNKKIKKKEHKKQKKLVKVSADEQMEITVTAPETAVAEDVQAKPLSRKQRVKLRAQESKAAKAKITILKKTKAQVRYNMARGIQGATNLTKNELNAQIMKLAQNRGAGRTAAAAAAADPQPSGDVDMAT